MSPETQTAIAMLAFLGTFCAFGALRVEDEGLAIGAAMIVATCVATIIAIAIPG